MTLNLQGFVSPRSKSSLFSHHGGFPPQHPGLSPHERLCFRYVSGLFHFVHPLKISELYFRCHQPGHQAAHCPQNVAGQSVNACYKCGLDVCAFNSGGAYTPGTSSQKLRCVLQLQAEWPSGSKVPVGASLVLLFLSCYHKRQ